MNFQGFSTGNRTVQVITTDVSTLQQDLCESHRQRLASRGGHFTEQQLIPVYCAALVGYDNDDTYNNCLFNLKDALLKSRKPVIFKDKKFDNPMNNELQQFGNFDRTSRNQIISGLCARISFGNDTVRTDLARRTLNDMLTHDGSPDSILYNKGVKLSVWFMRCAGAMSSLTEIPMLLYYGAASQLEIQLFHLLSCTGFDVLYICPDKSCLTLVKDGNYQSRMQIFEQPLSKELMPYPVKEVKAKVATVAYNAERELDTILYGGDTLFRDFQFSDMESAVLKTTYDEVDILWHQQAKFRPGFEVRNGRVKVPTIFAKISGVPDGNLNKYWDSVRDKLSPLTILSVKSPTYKRLDQSAARTFDPYHDGHNIFTEKLKSSRLNQYGFLSDELQRLIFEKLQETNDSGFLTFSDSRERIQQILFAGMNLDRNLLRILQKYDFTKDIPKFIVIDAIEDTFSETECVQLVLMSMLGFDVLVYTPTGYRNMETFISPNAFELHQMNEFVYNTAIPRFKIPDKFPQNNKGGLFQNLFKKGRR